MLGEQHISEAVEKAEERVREITNDWIYRSQLQEGIDLLKEELLRIYNEEMNA